MSFSDLKKQSKLGSLTSKLVKEANVIIALGTRLGFNSTFYSYENINKKAKIIQVELEKRMIGRYFPVVVGINGDAATVAEQLYKEYLNNISHIIKNIMTLVCLAQELQF